MPIFHELDEHILHIEISRPEKRNTLDAAMLTSMTELLVKAHNDEDIRVVFIHAQPGLFCAGGDLSEQLSGPSALPTTVTGQFIEALKACPKPIVACVQGPAVGLAVTMLYYCDLVYASAKSLFSLPFTALGLTPRYGVSLLTLLNGGYHKAAEKILLSEPISAPEAFEMRLVSNIFEEDRTYAQAWARAQRLAQLSPVSVQSSKRLLRQAWSTRLQEITHAESEAFHIAAQTPHAKEACAAFLEGRKPNFENKD